MMLKIAAAAAVLAGHALAFPVGTVTADKQQFQGQKLVRVSFDDDKLAPTLRALGETYGMDLWGHGTDWVDIRVQHDQELSMLETLGASFETLIEDLQAHIESVESMNAANKDNSNIHDDYHELEDLYELYRGIAAEHPDLVQMQESIGQSIEGRDLKLLTLSGNSATATRRIYFECGIHAREWISPAMCLYFVDHFTSQYGVDDRVTNIMDNFEFHLVPVTNPDGYVYTWSDNRMWRKNRRNNGGGQYGVDLNRNFDAHWGEGGSSSYPGSDTYMGTAPESEPEVKTVTDYIRSFNDDGGFLTGIDFHAYSQLILRPWGYTMADSEDEALLFDLGAAMQEAIKSVHGTHFQNIKSIELYKTTGTCNDWFYYYDRRMWGYTLELRDTGRYGFLLPPDQIIPSGEELMEGILAFMNYVYTHHPEA